MENELGVLLFDRVKRPPVTKATFWVEAGTAGIIIDKAINMATSTASPKRLVATLSL